jgi:hypothetical protein
VRELENIALINEISEKVYEISGMAEDTQEEIKSVRSDGGGGDSGVSGDERESSDSNNVGDDSGTSSVHADSGSEGSSEATGG